jgi:hypothetical protein
MKESSSTYEIYTKEERMRAWKYHLGVWTEFEDPLVVEGEELNVTLKRAGYNSAMNYGEEGVFEAEVYRAEGSPLEWLIIFSLDVGSFECVYIEDIPSLMQWQRDFATFYMLERMDYRLNELTEAARRAFRAWHGHESENVCDDCDPLETRRREQRRQEMLKDRVLEENRGLRWIK